MTALQLSSVADTIIDLAMDIARASPECADKANQIAELAREVERMPDRAAVQDALEAHLVDTEASECQSARDGTPDRRSIGGLTQFR